MKKHAPPTPPPVHHPLVTECPLQVSFDKGLNSTDLGFLPLMLLLSDAGCDVTQIYNSRPELVSTFNLTKNTLFREKQIC